MEASRLPGAGSMVVAGLRLTSVLFFGAVLSFIAGATLADVAVGLGHTGGPVLARLGLTGVHSILAQPALESRRAVAEVGGAAVHTEASILAQVRDLHALAHCSFLAGHREVTVRSCPSLEAQALEGGAALKASGSVWAGLLGAPVNQSLAAASCIARVAEAAGTLRCVLAGRLVLAGAVCTAGLDLPFTAEPLEARGTEAEEGARLVHTGTPVEARGRYTVVDNGLAEGACVTQRTGAEIALRAGVAGATIETGP